MGAFFRRPRQADGVSELDIFFSYIWLHGYSQQKNCVVNGLDRKLRPTINWKVVIRILVRKQSIGIHHVFRQGHRDRYPCNFACIPAQAS